VTEYDVEGQSMRDEPQDAVGDSVNMDVGLEGCRVCWRKEARC
jgi:hypothetical protein